jgi:hypothetical protein
LLVGADFDLSSTYGLAGWEGSSYYVNILVDNIGQTGGTNIFEGKFHI